MKQIGAPRLDFDRRLPLNFAPTAITDSRLSISQRPAQMLIDLLNKVGTAEGAQKPADMLAGRGYETHDFIC